MSAINMKYVAAYMLASMSRENPSLEDIEKIIAAASSKVDRAQIAVVCESLRDKNVYQLIAKGHHLVACMPSFAEVREDEDSENESEDDSESEDESSDCQMFSLFGNDYETVQAEVEESQDNSDDGESSDEECALIEDELSCPSDPD